MNATFDLSGVFRRHDQVDVWLGVESFEDRSTESLRVLVNAGIRVRRVRVLTYRTNVRPKAEDDAMREKNRDEIERLSRQAGAAGPDYLPADPYQRDDMKIALRGQDCADSRGVLDLTTATKLHTVAAGAELATDRRFARLVYAIPEAYGAGSDGCGYHRPVRREPIDADRVTMPNWAEARGLMLLGHDSDRIRTALDGVPALEGTVVIARSARQPDFARLTERANSQTMHQLTQRNRWTRVAVDVLDWRRLEDIAQVEARRAREAGAPIVLYPFGPKPCVALLTRALATAYPEGAWMAYAIPHGYDVGYSRGVSGCAWYSLEQGLERR